MVVVRSQVIVSNPSEKGRGQCGSMQAPAFKTRKAISEGQILAPSVVVQEQNVFFLFGRARGGGIFTYYWYVYPRGLSRAWYDKEGGGRSCGGGGGGG